MTDLVGDILVDVGMDPRAAYRIAGKLSVFEFSQNAVDALGEYQRSQRSIMPMAEWAQDAMTKEVLPNLIPGGIISTGGSKVLRRLFAKKMEAKHFERLFKQTMQYGKVSPASAKKKLGTVQTIQRMMGEYKGNMSSSEKRALNKLVNRSSVKRARDRIYKETQRILREDRKLPEKFMVFRGGELKGPFVSVSIKPQSAQKFAIGGRTNQIGAYMVDRRDIIVDSNGILQDSAPYMTELEYIVRPHQLRPQEIVRRDISAETVPWARQVDDFVYKYADENSEAVKVDMEFYAQKRGRHAGGMNQHLEMVDPAGKGPTKVAPEYTPKAGQTYSKTEGYIEGKVGAPVPAGTPSVAPGGVSVFQSFHDDLLKSVNAGIELPSHKSAMWTKLEEIYYKVAKGSDPISANDYKLLTKYMPHTAGGGPIPANSPVHIPITKALRPGMPDHDAALAAMHKADGGQISQMTEKDMSMLEKYFPVTWMKIKNKSAYAQGVSEGWPPLQQLKAKMTQEMSETGAMSTKDLAKLLEQDEAAFSSLMTGGSGFSIPDSMRMEMQGLVKAASEGALDDASQLIQYVKTGGKELSESEIGILDAYYPEILSISKVNKVKGLKASASYNKSKEQ